MTARTLAAHRLLLATAILGCSALATAQPTDHPEVARDETARALERALVRQGGLVLRPAAIELEPDLDYLYRESNALRRDTVTGTITARIGLPLGAQADARVPYMIADHSPGFRTRSALGDVALGLTKQLLVGGPGTPLPDLLLTARWKTTTGASDGDRSPGTGANTIQALFTGVRRDDPLVLVGTAYYMWSLRSGDVARGDAVGVILRTLLAATPDTSLLIGFDVASVFATKAKGVTEPGTDRLSGVLNIGLYTSVARDLFLNVAAGVGVTPAAPDFELTVALPFRL
ncbi:MAG TPA: hypothetical protein VF912_09075 [Anaeromyxobacter sp.]